MGESCDSRIASRSELYEQVWSEPMTKVAPKYGLSDVGLAKLCEKHQIPCPPVDHWAKLAQGKASPRPPLPELDPADLEEIRLFRSAFDRPTTPAAAKPKPVIEVAERLVKPHRLVEQAKSVLSRERPNHCGLLVVGNLRCLDVTVTRKSLPRALRVLDALIKHWESEGGSVSAGEHATRFSLGDDSISLSLSEEVRRHEKPSQYRYTKDYRYEATGKLSLHVDGFADGLRKTWSDGKVQRLEMVLGSVVVGLRAWIDHVHQRRLDRECEARQTAKAQQRREEREQQKQLEQKRREGLEAAANSWVKAQHIRSYLAALEEKLAGAELKPCNPESFDHWLKWAHWYADFTCPLTPSGPFPETSQQPNNTPIYALDLTKKTRETLEKVPAKDTDEICQFDRKQLREYCDSREWIVWNEVTRVLEGLGYDVSGRRGHWL